tara:strand:+ start:103 stop:534 length:432 start_codon:yes stop_codon:yes gene_type:complete
VNGDISKDSAMRPNIIITLILVIALVLFFLWMALFLLLREEAFIKETYINLKEYLQKEKHMKATNENYKRYCKLKEDLISFLNRQSKFMKKDKDWTLLDHVFLVMETCITQLRMNDYNDDQIQAEIDAIMMYTEKKQQPPSLH